MSEETSSAFIGVVTVLFQSDTVIPDFLASLAAQRDSAVRLKLYVIDNSPTRSGTDLLLGLIGGHGIEAECTVNAVNNGVAAGNNQGIRAALADGCTHVLLANNDTAFAAGTVAGLLATLMAQKASAVSPKMYFHGTQGQLWYAGGGLDPWTARTPHFGIGQKDVGQFDRTKDTAYAPTTFMLIDCRVFDQIGMLDEQYFCYYEDTDFVFRLRQAAGRIVYDPAHAVAHKVSTSTGGAESAFSLFYMTRNRVYFARKNLRGLQRAVALCYITATRLRSARQLAPAKAERVLAGLKAGWQMPLPPKNA